MRRSGLFLCFVLIGLFLFPVYALAAAKNDASLTEENIISSEEVSQRDHQREFLVRYKPGFAAKARRNLMANGMAGKSLGQRTQLMRVEDADDVKAAMKKLKNDPAVEVVEPNFMLHAFDVAPASITRQPQTLYTPNDTYYGEQWGLTCIKAPQAWEHLGQSQREIIVAVIDTGIELTHPDLINRIAPGGYNFVLEGTDIYDLNGHGTCVSGVIAAEAGNSKGICGVSGLAPVKILPLQAGDSKGTMYASDLLAAVDYAISKNVDVINISFGSADKSVLEEAAIRDAVDHGIVVVASAGNDGNTTVNYPASYPGVISVGSVSKTAENQYIISSFSSYNNEVDLAAPGDNICTTALQQGYASKRGTSFSAPMAAGVLALIKSCRPSLNGQSAASILLRTAADLGLAGRDNYYGYGLVDAGRAVEAALIVPDVISVSAIPDIYTAWGSAGRDLPLTTSITVQLSNSTRISCPVNWDSGNPVYNGDQPGLYRFTGNLVLPLEVCNPVNLQAHVNIVVEDITKPALCCQLINTYLSDYFTAETSGDSVMATCQPDKIDATLQDSFSIAAMLPILLDLNAAFTVDSITISDRSFSHDEIFNNISLARAYEIQAALLGLAGKTQNGRYADLTLQDLAGKSIEIVLQGTPLTINLEAPDKCFIATAAFGSPFTWPVKLLRHFRDQFLLANHPGQALVAFYYRHAPPIARLAARSSYLRLFIRVLLFPVVILVYLLIHPGLATLIIAIILLLYLSPRFKYVTL